MRLMTVMLLTSNMSEFDLGQYFNNHGHDGCPNRGCYTNSFGGMYGPYKIMCQCKAPKNWFFPHDVRYVRQRQVDNKIDAEHVAPPLK